MMPPIVRTLRGMVSPRPIQDEVGLSHETLQNPQFSVLPSRFRPQDALVHFRHRSQAFIDKLLQSLPAICLRRVNVALRVRRDAVDGVELARLASTVAEIG